MLKIFTDTSANLPRELIERNNLTVIPFHYSVNGKEMYQENGDEFDGKAFYSAMREGSAIKTSMVNVGAFVDAFSLEVSSGNEVLYVGMSSGISGTYHAASMASDLVHEDFPDCKLAVIDTKAASLGEGLPVLYACKLASINMPFDEIVENVTKNAAAICQYFTVDDLTYLQKGGRISKVTAIVGTILNIKPLLKGDEDGKIVLFQKARGRKKALEALVSKYSQLVLDKTMPIGIAHADSSLDAMLLEASLRESGLKGEAITVCYEPVTGSHVGPGTVALFFYGTSR